MKENESQDTWSHIYIPVEDIPGWDYAHMTGERIERLPHVGCIREEKVSETRIIRIMHDRRFNTCHVFFYEKLEEEKPMYSGKFDIEVTGLAMMRQRFTLDIAMPRTKEEMEDIAKGIVNNHVWEYEGMQDDTLEVTLVAIPLVKKETL